MNILVLSCGTRNKIVQYFRKTCHEYGGKVYAADCSNLAPALYDADEFFISKRLGEEGHIEEILAYCKEKHIDGVLSLIDPELSFLAEQGDKLNDIGTTVIGSTYDLCERSLDKYEMYQWLAENGYKTAKSWIDKEAFHRDIDNGESTYPVFVKPAKGSASISISIAYDRETVDVLFEHENGLMIQEYMCGQEIGADVYIDMISGEVVSIFTKNKIKMRAGETDKGISFKDEKLFELIKDFATKAGYRGQIDIDIFDINGEYYISEVNPRFGGGYPHAYEAGCDHMKLIAENLSGHANKPMIGQYDEGVVMMKYNEIKMIRGGYRGNRLTMFCAFNANWRCAA